MTRHRHRFRAPAASCLVILALAMAAGGWTARAAESVGKAPSSSQAEAVGLAYSVRFEGPAEPGLQAKLESVSQLLALRDRLPATRAGLDRRAGDDRDRFEALLRAEGFYGGRVDYRVAPGDGDEQVLFAIDEGPIYLLAEATVDRRGDAGPAVGAEDIGLSIGMPARAAPIIAAESRLIALLAEEAHPLARVLEREVTVDHDRTTLAVRFALDAGPRTRFGAVHFVGVEGVDDNFLRRKLPWREGDPYDARRVEALRKDLQASALFDAVDIRPADAVAPDGSMPLTVTATRAKERSIGAGLAYSTDRGPSAKALWEHRNFAGAGESLDLALEYGLLGGGFDARFRKPEFPRAQRDLVASATLKDRNEEAFDEASVALGLGFERRYANRWVLAEGVALEYADLVGRDEQQTFLLFGLPTRATLDRTDNLLDPTRGARLRLAFTPYLGSLEEAIVFAAADATGSAYQALDAGRRVVVAARLRLGTVLADATERLPANKRLYAGGGGSIRGFESQRVGPLRADGDPVGGRSVIELGLEARLRLTETIGIVPFVDGGNVYDGILPDFAEAPRWAAGIGGRYHTPFGPVRADIAFPLNRRRNIDDAYQFYLSFGQAF